MGIGDYIWPFDKKFSKIPCAREASISALIGGPALGALRFIQSNNGKIAYKTSIYGGFVVFWISFIYCRYQYNAQKKLSKQFQEAYKKGKFD